jgi:hypothetical protein
MGDLWAENATQSVNHRTLRDKSLDYGPSSYDTRHVLQAFGTYDLPFGRDRRFNIENKVLNAIAGGWVLGGVLTAQSAPPFRLGSGGRQTFNNFTDAGVVLKNGHTVQEIQSMIRIRPGPVDPVLGRVVTRYYFDERLIGPDGRANPEYLGVPTTPGEFGQFITLRGKNNWNFDMSLNKTTTLIGRSQITVHLTITNLLNYQVWNTPGHLQEVSIQSTSFGLTNNPINGARQVYSRVSVKF